MPKDFEDTPRERARNKAERRWHNHAVEKRVKENLNKAKLVPQEPQELKVGQVIDNKRRLAGSVIRAQTKFAKELRTMLEGHTHRNLVEYKLALHARIHRLKREKLKRLEARVAQQNQGVSNV